MKHIQKQAETESALNEWCQGSRLLVASHYFWISGIDSLQKSLEGFYRSILHQLLSQVPELIPHLFPYKERSAVDLSLERLETVFRFKLPEEMLKYGDPEDNPRLTLKCCLFIDGLDEFEENGIQDCDQRIASILSELVRSFPHIKICASSRPSSAFRTHFEHPLDAAPFSQTIVVEEFTRADMEMFALAKLSKMACSKRKFQKDSRWKDIGKILAAKAEGVWLWTTLVMQSVLREFGRDESFDTILTIIRDYPSDLEKLFKTIVEKLDDRHRLASSAIFSVLVEATYPVSAADIRLFLLKPDKQFSEFGFVEHALSSSLCYPPELETLDSIRNQLHNRCGDLVEVSYYDRYEPNALLKLWKAKCFFSTTASLSASPPASDGKSRLSFPGLSSTTASDKAIIQTKVDFIHRSVRDCFNRNPNWLSLSPLSSTLPSATHSLALGAAFSPSPTFPASFSPTASAQSATPSNSEAHAKMEAPNRYILSRLNLLAMVVSAFKTGAKMNKFGSSGSNCLKGQGSISETDQVLAPWAGWENWPQDGSVSLREFRRWYLFRFCGFFFHASELDKELRVAIKEYPNITPPAESICEKLNDDYQFDPHSLIGKLVDRYIRLVAEAFRNLPNVTCYAGSEAMLSPNDTTTRLTVTKVEAAAARIDKKASKVHRIWLQKEFDLLDMTTRLRLSVKSWSGISSSTASLIPLATLQESPARELMRLLHQTLTIAKISRAELSEILANSRSAPGTIPVSALFSYIAVKARLLLYLLEMNKTKEIRLLHNGARLGGKMTFRCLFLASLIPTLVPNLKSHRAFACWSEKWLGGTTLSLPSSSALNGRPFTLILS